MFYISNFGPWWFMERYLAPVLLLAIPWLATALELRRPSPRALPALAAIVIAANVPMLAVLASGTASPPAWAARDSNLGAHPNLNVTEQLAWIDDHVSPNCVVGAFETGTLLYFRDRTVNLDGKVDHDALEARLDGRSPDYVDARGVDVMVDIESGPPRGLREGAFHEGRGHGPLRGVGPDRARRRVPYRVGPPYDPDPTTSPTRHVFPIGLGGMPMSLSSRPPEERSLRTIQAALDAGVNFIDTADAYSADDADFGHNERLIAKALDGRRDGVLIATKGGHTRTAGGGWELNGRPEYLKRACEASLKALGTDRIDLYQYHRPDPHVPYAESIGALKELQDEGKVRWIGISNADTDQIAEALRDRRHRLRAEPALARVHLPADQRRGRAVHEAGDRVPAVVAAGRHLQRCRRRRRARPGARGRRRPRRLARSRSRWRGCCRSAR